MPQQIDTEHFDTCVATLDNVSKYIKKMKTIAKLASVTGILCLSAFAQSVSPKCIDELTAVAEKKSSDLPGFSKDLVTEVVKVKAQMKLPFGKPADSKVTDIGMTVGCLKTFPENPAGILTMLKDAGLGAATKSAGAAVKKGFAAGESGASAEETPAEKKSKPAVAVASGPSLKECDAIFNPAKKFCYDGGVYDLCDGMSYNPTVYICQGDIANRALCNGVQYNPLKQKCKNNEILSVCGGIEYNQTTHDCKDNVVLPRCGKTVYDPKTSGCKNNSVFPKCRETLYDPATQGCKDNVVFDLPKCGAVVYNPATRVCKDNAIYAKCGDALYDPAVYTCKDNDVVVFPKCGDAVYNPATQGCKDNVIVAKCGGTIYDPAVYACKDNVVLARCGGTKFYNPKTHECRFNDVFPK